MKLPSIQVARAKTNMEEFNRVLGGGVVPGESGPDRRRSRDWQMPPDSWRFQHSFLTIGTVLYVSGEESAQQIKLRVNVWATSTASSHLYVETNMQSIRTEIEKISQIS